MSLTRKGLKAMGLTEEQVDSIIEAHTETVDGLKEKLKAAQVDAEKLADVKKELDDLKAKGQDGYKERFEKEHKDFEEFKKSITDKENKQAREKAARLYFEGKNITGTNLDIAMRAAANEINSLELDGESIKDTSVLDELTGGTLAGLVAKTSVVGVQTAHPPATAPTTSKTREEIMSIKDTAERQKAWAIYLNERKK